MNWFNVLKEQRQVARNIQSFKPIQFDKPIKLNKPEENCYEKLLDYCSEHGERTDSDEYRYVFKRFNSEYSSEIYVRKDIPHPDELYCYALEEFKKIMETPKEEIKDSSFSTKGLEIFIQVREYLHKSIYCEITDIYDSPIIEYIYLYGDN